MSSSGNLLNSTIGRKRDLAPVGAYIRASCKQRAHDVTQSILFTILFAVVLPIGIWRYVKRTSRTGTLILPILFCPIRIATYIVRALMAQGDRSNGMIVAEMVLLTAASYFVIEPLITLSRLLLERSVPYYGPTVDENGRALGRKDRIGWLGTILDLALLASLVLAIYSGSITSKAFKNPDTARTVLRLRRVAHFMSMVSVVVGLLIVALGYYHFLKGFISPKSAYFLLLAGILNMIPCALKLAQAYLKPGANSITAFWVAQALPEL
ncbi:hypothetical protein AURDEDRAFT_71786 [Auricularia subglabra TFB-10046 SS5]|nr:hypothetical protein AURDEDRAFT_71786 [Auricularia subglabra TFB-10046 SS5]